MGKTAKQPIERGKLRLWLGIGYFRLRRYAKWITGGTRFARERGSSRMAFVAYRHQTPLLRKLSQVDMRLQHNKVRNLLIAVRAVDGIVVKPGETFSYWRLIGKPTRRKGYVDGMILSNGRVTEGTGGGLCQLSNLIYWMTLHTPLAVTERHRHSYDVFPDANRTQPFGSGATCYYNYVDLQIYNPTKQAFQLCVALSETHLAGEWRSESTVPFSYEIYEKEHRIAQQSWGGYTRHNVLHRSVFGAGGERVRDEYVTENHALMMYSSLLASGSDKEKRG
ncbi:VanW family protein [Paenibacillus sp. MBLB4367]|uniref:VanW family protein n=1 Tax=Paenibacillus sp. MBLB4367 TaxID=3384767 RepID=UPI0039080EFF